MENGKNLHAGRGKLRVTAGRAGESGENINITTLFTETIKFNIQVHMHKGLLVWMKMRYFPFNRLIIKSIYRQALSIMLQQIKNAICWCTNI